MSHPSTTVSRLPEKQRTSRTELDELLDSTPLATIALIRDGHPVIFPIGFARIGDELVIHGSTGSPWLRQLADGAASAFVPQCGLAPGYISICAADIARRFDSLREVQMRVGALPVFPTNALKYNLTWSTDGLINEYCNPCESIRDGELIEVPALEELEAFSLDGVEYEAFNTSGGLGTLCETLKGKVENLNYKTVRYPGHRDIVKMLVRDLRLAYRRDLLKDVLEASIPITFQDVVLVFVTVSGERDGRLTQESYARKVYAQTVEGKLMSAIQITTAAGICAMVDLMAEGRLPQKGFVRQEETLLADFHANRFGRYYAQGH